MKKELKTQYFFKHTKNIHSKVVRVTENDPAHAQEPNAMDATDLIGWLCCVEDLFAVGNHWEWQQNFLC